ncbi:MAG: ribokinase [Candidatus Heimdallarchaeota archaeon]|nr:ribokinase [Candidatus Heimdallarchaeota archaeon]
MKNDPYILIIGSSNIDLNIYSKRFPKPGETVTGGKFTQSFGGKGANQAVAAARSGSKVKFIGRVGNDNFGNQMISNLKKESIDVKNIIIDQTNPSGVAFILLDAQGQNMISVAPGANALVSLKEIFNIKTIIEDASAVVVQMEIHMDIITEIFNNTKDSTLSILNPAPFKPIPEEILKKLKIITPNENELLELHSSLGLNNPNLLDENALISISRDISRIGVENVITTLGQRGCFVYQAKSGKASLISGIKVNPVDTVGAGDCFNGVLTSYVVKGYDIFTAAKYANTAASIAVTRRGAQNSMPLEDEILSRFNEVYK